MLFQSELLNQMFKVSLMREPASRTRAVEIAILILDWRPIVMINSIDCSDWLISKSRNRLDAAELVPLTWV